MARALLPVRAGCMADMFAGLQLGGVRGAAAASRAPVLVRPRALGPAACWRGAGANSVRGLTAGPGPVGRGEADGLILAGSQSAVLAVAMRSVAGLVRDTKQQGMGLGGTRGISSTAPRTTGLNDFFVSFPDLDKDDKPMYPAVGARQPLALLQRLRVSLLLPHVSPTACKPAGAPPHDAFRSRACMDGCRAATKVVRRPA